MIFNKNFPATVFALVFLLILFLMWKMFSGFIGAIIFGAIIAGSFYKVYFWTNKKLNNKKELASILVCLFVVIVIFLPLVFICIQLSKEAVMLYTNLSGVLNQEAIHDFLYKDGLFAGLLKKISTITSIELGPEVLKEKLTGLANIVSGKLLISINAWIGNVFRFLFNFFIMLLTMYILFIEGANLKKFVLKLSPLPDDQEELLIDKFNQMNYVTLVCNGIGGVIQGILAGGMFWAMGINSVLLWSTVMVLLAFIPILGISIIYIPVTIYLLIKGAFLKAIILFVWCTLVAIFIENLFKPKFIGKRIKLNSFFVLACIIGGMGAFDMAGIFYGPIIGILFITLVDLYHQFYSHEEAV